MRKTAELQLLDAFGILLECGTSQLYCLRLVGWVDVKFPRAGFLLASGGSLFFNLPDRVFVTVALRGQLTCRASHS